MASSAYYASQLRHELRERNLEFAKKYRLPHQFSYGGAPIVCYEPNGFRHGNFLPETYEAILENPAWARRLRKAHTAKGHHLPRNDRNFWAELDSCTSSDALLMNVFCHPGTFEDGRVLSMLGVESNIEERTRGAHGQGTSGGTTHGQSTSGGAAEFVSPPRQRWERSVAQRFSAGDAGSSPPESRRDDTLATPEFGFKPRVPLLDGHFDRTEVDMRLGNVLIEAKLTEPDFQSREREFVNAYRDFADVFHRRDLPQTRECYLGYQLIRNVLAAHALDCSFCVLHDARRPDLREQWYEVMKCVKSHALRTRCKVLTWQELAAALPEELQAFLEEKYGIVAHL